jgi:hypothetical protein
MSQPVNWDPSAVMAVTLVLGALAVSVAASFVAMRRGDIPDTVLKMIVALVSLVLISGLKFYDQVESDVVTFVFGAIIGYIFSGKAISHGDNSTKDKDA